MEVHEFYEATKVTALYENDAKKINGQLSKLVLSASMIDTSHLNKNK